MYVRNFAYLCQSGGGDAEIATAGRHERLGSQYGQGFNHREGGQSWSACRRRNPEISEVLQSMRSSSAVALTKWTMEIYVNIHILGKGVNLLRPVLMALWLRWQRSPKHFRQATVDCHFQKFSTITSNKSRSSPRYDIPILTLQTSAYCSVLHVHYDDLLS
jgi:hypothetical protein